MNKSKSDSTVDYYENFAKEYIARTLKQDLSPQYGRFISLLPRGARILDAGCGSGRDLKVFQEEGYSVIGFDSSSALVEYCRRYTGAPCLLLSFREVIWDQEFDGIWACASLLHVPKNEIIDIVKRLCLALKPEGIMYISLRKGIGEKVLPDGRYFANYSETEFLSVIEQVREMELVDSWVTEDAASNRTDVRWLNYLVKRVEE